MKFKVGDIVRPNPKEFRPDIQCLTFEITSIEGGYIRGIWSDNTAVFNYDYKPHCFLPAPELIIDRLLEKYN